MRRLAIWVVCASVCVGFASPVAAAPEEEDLLFEPPPKDAIKRPPLAKPAEKTEFEKKAPGKKSLSKKASKALASAHRRMVTKASPMPAVNSAVPSFYIGLHFGGGWSHFSASNPLQDAAPGGVLGGVQFGVNYQVDHLVFGIEADFSGAALRRDVSGDLNGTAVTGHARNDWFATLAGRFGFASGATLSYLKAGGAWTHNKWDFNDGLGNTASSSATRSGWVVGVGVEQAINSALSAKIEYNYMNFGSRTETLATTGGLVALPTAIRLDAHVVKLGFNHRFSY